MCFLILFVRIKGNDIYLFRNEKWLNQIYPLCYIHIYICTWIFLFRMPTSIHRQWRIYRVSYLIIPRNSIRLFNFWKFYSLLCSSISFCCKLLYFLHILFIRIFIVFIFYFKLYLLCCYYTFKKDKNNWIPYFIYILFFFSIMILRILAHLLNLQLFAIIWNIYSLISYYLYIQCNI